jgi:asparagine synthetase B (glutamine-hydrolysing)
VAEAAGLTHHVLESSLEELLEELPWVVHTLQTFDPMALRNDIAGTPPLYLPKSVFSG